MPRSSAATSNVAGGISVAARKNSKSPGRNSNASGENSQKSRPAFTAALYCRVSTVDRGQDIGLQVDELRQLAAQRGLEVVAEYLDDGISGTRDDRPALKEMLAAPQAGKFSVLLVWRLDRLGRGGLPQLLRILDDLAAWGVGFASAREPGMDSISSTGRLLLQLLAVFSSYEVSCIQDRVRAGVARAQAAGTHCGRPRVEVADQQLEAARKLIAEGWSWRAVEKATGIKKDTLRRRLAETADEVSQKSTPGEGS